MFLVFWFHAGIEDARVPTVLQLQLRRCTAASASIAASIVRVLNVTKENVKKTAIFLSSCERKILGKHSRTCLKERYTLLAYWRSYDNLRYLKCDGEVEKNESKAEKVAAI